MLRGKCYEHVLCVDDTQIPLGVLACLKTWS
jgi:hypothetical protein